MSHVLTSNPAAFKPDTVCLPNNLNTVSFEINAMRWVRSPRMPRASLPTSDNTPDPIRMSYLTDFAGVRARIVCISQNVSWFAA